MTAAEIRQSFLDFFQEKEHALVASASLLPQSPGLLFTNAGMNQFVPYFLGTETAPYQPPRAADTQKCIRAGGKHNDLEDVGLDTYHHTFFEMLGNWSFGDYFKAEAIQWAWELLVERWGLPAERLYATVYAPAEADPSAFDQEAWDLWAALFRKAGLDPAVHIVNGNVKDNFWMMGDTGPCGPCSEVHMDLTPKGDTGGQLVNMDSDQCIEIWNLVFIQFNAEADGTFRDLPAKHVDTGMGFERVCSILQGTQGCRDFSQKISNYATDVFTPLFQKLEQLTGEKYEDIYPGKELETENLKLKTAIAFRVIADHVRTLSFSIADGILPGNNGRNYVLRRILRRAVRYGRDLGFKGDQPFLPELVSVLTDHFGDVFPEIRQRTDLVRETLAREENSFNETLDRGLKLFEAELEGTKKVFSGQAAFKLYDTFGFPIDLTQLLARQRGLSVDMAAFESGMEKQRAQAQAAQKKEIVKALDIATETETLFVGFEQSECQATILEIHQQADLKIIITGRTPFYAEMGGQVGDTGTLEKDGQSHPIRGVQQIGQARGHLVSAEAALTEGDIVTLKLDPTRRRPIEAHHSATHLLHWALHEHVSPDASQQGSLVDQDRLRFDFSSGPLEAGQIAKVEAAVNACIQKNDPISWTEVPHAEVKERSDITQFFGDKYGETVRVVQIGGQAGALDGYSMELCGGTHVPRTGEIGLFKIKSEGAVAAGVRRIEAACGEAAFAYLGQQVEKWDAEYESARRKLAAANAQLTQLGGETLSARELPRIMEALLVEKGDFAQINATVAMGQAILAENKQAAIEAEKRVKKAQTARAAQEADAALTELIAEGGAIVASFAGQASLLQELLNGLKKKQFAGVAFLVVDDGEKAHLGTYSTEKAHPAGQLLQEFAPLVGGRGGGKPGMARGAGSQREGIETLLKAVRAKLA
ncbi:MAG: alanine--tRNA ligase [Verrucomicrobiota bacterium]